MEATFNPPPLLANLFLFHHSLLLIVIIKVITPLGGNWCPLIFWIVFTGPELLP